MRRDAGQERFWHWDTDNAPGQYRADICGGGGTIHSYIVSPPPLFWKTVLGKIKSWHWSADPLEGMGTSLTVKKLPDSCWSRGAFHKQWSNQRVTAYISLIAACAAVINGRGNVSRYHDFGVLLATSL